MCCDSASQNSKVRQNNNNKQQHRFTILPHIQPLHQHDGFPSGVPGPAGRTMAQLGSVTFDNNMSAIYLVEQLGG